MISLLITLGIQLALPTDLPAQAPSVADSATQDSQSRDTVTTRSRGYITYRAWAACAIPKVDRFASQLESAETIARVAVTNCGAERRTYRSAIYEQFRKYGESTASDTADKMADDGERELVARLTERVMERRVAGSK